MPFKKFGLEILSAVVPNMIANDIVSVQPMDHRVGEIRYVKYMYGSDKGQVRSGDEITSAKEFSGGNYQYSSEVVEDELVSDEEDTEHSFNLSWTPVRPGTIKIHFGSSLIEDDGDGNLEGDLVSGEVDYESGLVSITLSDNNDESIYADYRADFETAPVSAPRVSLKISTLPIVAKTRKLTTLYAFDAAYDLEQDYGMEINTELVGQIAASIKHEIDGEILENIRNAARTDVSDYSYDTPSGVSRQEHDDAFYNNLVEAGNHIFDRTKRATMNFVVVGTGVANVIETMRNFERAGDVTPVGPHLAGFVNGIPVYKNPYYPTNEYVVGFSGEGLFESGYVYAPYMPILTTSLIMTEDFTARKGFATSYGKKVVNPNMYQKGSIINT